GRVDEERRRLRRRQGAGPRKPRFVSSVEQDIAHPGGDGFIGSRRLRRAPACTPTPLPARLPGPVSSSTGVLLVNLGTPDAPDPAAVRRYLREFLSDPRVLDINPVGRWALLNLIILPRRPAASAEAYRKVWTDAGSPLLV